MSTEPVSPLAKLREPFPAHQISKLPKPTKNQTDEVKADYKKGVQCKICGSWHHPNVIHLDYVGHAALTDRLLDTDPEWSWEPVAFRDGLPAFDSTGGLWIRLTVCGVTRLGYGHAAAKAGIDPGTREKEVIGDALRNAAMRFGAALDLWHKGDLHVADDDGESEPKTPLWVTAAKAAIECLDDVAACDAWWKENVAMLKTQPQAERDDVIAKIKARKTALAPFPGDAAPKATEPKSTRVPINEIDPLAGDAIPF
jgi:hypothetical protein